ncbi:carbohydrate ABC transporter permease [Egicoccus sp. AB-alg6-2]|uniref:carbohydrate ABC transporter permease n=1 Tax=Egicoccus sp. AB-alg6-2 TaxID=3242692 RepID=UPI00359D67E1
MTAVDHEPDQTTAAATGDAGVQPRRPWTRPLGYAVLILLSVIYLAPLLWMLSTSFKTSPEATRWPLELLPSQITTAAYELLFRPGTDTPVLRWFLNSMIAATAHAVLVVATAAPAAYALARMDFRGKKLLFGVILSTLFIPPIIFLVPNYLIVDTFGWLDSLWAVIVPQAAGALGVFLLRQFFLGLPDELEEAALIDGANQFQVFWRVVLPLSKPALATLLVLAFLTNWNDFLWPVYVLFNPDSLTLPPGLARLQGAYTVNYPVIMAGGVIASAPVIALFVFAQRYVIEGVARSGLKG